MQLQRAGGLGSREQSWREGMTIDDNSSIYVGGLPYDITEDGLRRVFYIYGAVVAVKIINDRAVGGKCYGFVTFANPRSATQAINEMDGKAIDGRVVKVNEVRSRGGRSNFNHDSSRYDLERSIDDDDDVGRDRGRDYNYDRPRHNEGHRERWQGYDQSRERGHDRMRGYNRTGNRYVDEDRYQDYDRNVDDTEPLIGRKRERDWARESDKNNEQQRNIHHKSGDKDKQQPRLLNRSRFDEPGSRELSLESFDDEEDQGESKLAVSTQKLEEIRKEITRMEEMAADKQEVVSSLQEKCQKLEDSLIQAKKLTSHCHLQLSKLHKCYIQMRDYDEKMKKTEQELQWLVDSSSMDLLNDGGVIGDGRA
ncbi:glycine-rich RNA-binding protein RZ1A [Andrographis paniculata]|uniref:glycine-rich RNA-binding protein RZ1A n=1 Tax=Andrographis paniculata TaxID=175694 RepID=UPI0021E70C5A|nr:glycine-rich RNA-binding protein RZ1A [Andrographis paniculata]